MCKKLKFYFTNSKRNSNNSSSFLSSFLWISPGIKCPYRLKPIHKKEPQSDSSSAVRKHTPLSLHIIYLISLKNASFYYFFKHSNTPLTPQPLPEHYSASYLTSSEHIIRQESVLSSLLTFMILFFWYSIHKKPPTLDLSKVDGFLPVSRCDRIRTCDLCVPNAALYQAEPRIDVYEALCCLSNRASLYYHKFFCLSRKILYFFNFFEISNKAA